MKTLNLIRSAAVTLLLFATTSALADEHSKLSAADREAVLAKLKTNKVSLQGLTIVSKDGSPAINLGTGENGAEANNANDENLRLIAQLPEVEQVMIYKGKISANGLAALAALPKLRYLQMYATDVPAAAFAVLPKLTQLKSLSLSNYDVTDEILSYAGQIKGLKSFDQTQSAMTPAGFLKFLNSVESLEQLTLFGDYVDDACMKQIGQMKELKRFWTNSKLITSAGWVHLAGLAKMEDLFLSETNFGDDDTRALEGMKDLKNLGLNKTKITDAGMPSLAGLTKLHDLGLEGTRATDKGMAALGGMTELDNLYVEMTEVTAKGLAIVPKKDRMVMMRVGKAALSAKQIDELMTMYPGTQIFDPSGYWKPERVKAAMKELGKPWPPMPKEKDKPTQQKPEEKQEEQTAAIKALQKNGVDTNGITLSTDDLGGPYINVGGINSSRATANDENLALVAQLPQLKRVVLTRGNFTNVGLSKLNALTNLQNLLILDPDLNSGVIAALAELKIPYYLTFDKCEITDEILGRLANNPKFLKSLFIVTAPKLTPAAVAKFLDIVDDLEELNIGYLKDVIDDDGMKHLAKMKSLKRLWVESQKVTPAGWKVLAGLTEMDFLDVRGTSFDDTAMTTLEGMKDLHVLMLTKTQITDAGMQSIAGLTKLTDVSFSGTKLTDAGMVHVKGLTQLRNLYVSETDVTAKGLALVPTKEKMVMMSAGKAPLSPKQWDEMMTMYPGTQIFDTAGFWKPERIKAAMKELGKEYPPKK